LANVVRSVYRKGYPMNKMLIALGAASFVFSAATMPVMAEKQVTRTIKEASDFPALLTKAQAVCASKTFNLSVKLKAACASGEFPNVIKSGERFYDMGVGKELNVLINNM
jgi:hypothetical protein